MTMNGLFDSNVDEPVLSHIAGCRVISLWQPGRHVDIYIVKDALKEVADDTPFDDRVKILRKWFEELGLYEHDSLASAATE